MNASSLEGDGVSPLPQQGCSVWVLDSGGIYIAGLLCIL